MCGNSTGPDRSCTGHEVASRECDPFFYECSNATTFLGANGYIRLKGDMPNHALCSWNIDFRYLIDLASTQYISMNISTGVSVTQVNGDVVVAAYTLSVSSSQPDLSQLQPIRFEEKGLDNYYFPAKHKVYCNFLTVGDRQISYWNYLGYPTKADMRVEWTLVQPSTSSSSSSKWADITTIVAIVLVSVICCLCCLLVILRLVQISRRRRIYVDPDAPGLGQRGRNESSRRIYDRLASSRITNSAIELYLPVLKFSKDLVEVGEDICTVCFETYHLHSLVPDDPVRKLACKHVFHESCILSWLRARASEPICPNCKANPFSEYLERLQAEGSFNASNELQNSVASDGGAAHLNSPRPREP